MHDIYFELFFCIIRTGTVALHSLPRIGKDGYRLGLMNSVFWIA